MAARGNTPRGWSIIGSAEPSSDATQEVVIDGGLEFEDGPTRLLDAPKKAAPPSRPPPKPRAPSVERDTAESLPALDDTTTDDRLPGAEDLTGEADVLRTADDILQQVIGPEASTLLEIPSTPAPAGRGRAGPTPRPSLAASAGPKIGTPEADLTMLHPAAAIGIAPEPLARPPAEALAEPVDGLRMPAPSKAPAPIADKLDSPLVGLEAPPPVAPPHALGEHGLRAANWAAENLGRLRMIVRIVALSSIVGLLLAGSLAVVANRGLAKRRAAQSAAPVVAAPSRPVVAEPSRPVVAPEAPPPSGRIEARRLKITSRPPYALVTINGAEVGRTPVIVRAPEKNSPLAVAVRTERYTPWTGRCAIVLTDPARDVLRVDQQSYTASPGESPAADTGDVEIEIALTPSIP